MVQSGFEPGSPDYHVASVVGSLAVKDVSPVIVFVSQKSLVNYCPNGNRLVIL